MATWPFSFARSKDPTYALRAALSAALISKGPVHTTLPTWARVQGMVEARGGNLLIQRWPTKTLTVTAPWIGR